MPTVPRHSPREPPTPPCASCCDPAATCGMPVRPLHSPLPAGEGLEVRSPKTCGNLRHARMPACSSSSGSLSPLGITREIQFRGSFPSDPVDRPPPPIPRRPLPLSIPRLGHIIAILRQLAACLADCQTQSRSRGNLRHAWVPALPSPRGRGVGGEVSQNLRQSAACLEGCSPLSSWERGWG
jgi:hypothetical protein